MSIHGKNFMIQNRVCKSLLPRSVGVYWEELSNWRQRYGKVARKMASSDNPTCVTSKDAKRKRRKQGYVVDWILEDAAYTDGVQPKHMRKPDQNELRFLKTRTQLRTRKRKRMTNALSYLNIRPPAGVFRGLFSRPSRFLPCSCPTCVGLGFPTYLSPNFAFFLVKLRFTGTQMRGLTARSV